jgi:hypothetical protein
MTSIYLATFVGSLIRGIIVTSLIDAFGAVPVIFAVAFALAVCIALDLRDYKRRKRAQDWRNW